MALKLSEERVALLWEELDRQVEEDGFISINGTASRLHMSRNTVRPRAKVWGFPTGDRRAGHKSPRRPEDHHGNMRSFLRRVRREVGALTPRAFRQAERIRASYWELNTKWKSTPRTTYLYVPWPRTWLGLEGAEVVFLAEHRPRLLEAYDRWGDAEASFAGSLTDMRGRPLPMTGEGLAALEKVQARYVEAREALLRAIDDLLEADEFPGSCPFCPDSHGAKVLTEANVESPSTTYRR